MKKKLKLAYSIFLIGICFNLSTNAQSIRGRIISQTDRQPLGFASVFLNNTQKGGTSDENGNFSISDLQSGTYEIVASYVGYHTFFQSIQISQTDIEITIELKPQTLELQEVVVTEDKNWKYNYETFVRSFIGQTPHSKSCKIVNPDILSIKFDADSALLKVRSKDFLIIENQALGYRLKYLLKNFSLYYRHNYQTHWGFAFFENLIPKNKRQAQKWRKNRLEAYSGSSQHFFKSLYHQNHEQEGFLVRKLRKVANPNRRPETTIRYMIRELMTQKYSSTSDTLQYWLNEAKKPKIVEVLEPNLLPIDSIRHKTDSLPQLQFADYLYIVYKKEKESLEYLQQNGLDINKRNYQSSTIHLIEPYALIEANGILRNPLAVIMDGYWGWQEKIAEILPFDYTPESELQDNDQP
ncbi:MAG: carboxypeptidase-like regulatory domain-containing protein [Microscillaceae bacterium]|jgi:hypothetical protein|nr:carboxypeptidase-like regulatory domain-containing protein [Microscillaceae bacterium]